MPVTQEQHEKSLDNPALCEQLPVRDYLDNVMVRTNGALVAGYEVRGITSYFASDEERDRSKVMLGALLKSIPEQSMRVQVRYEVTEDLGNLLEVYTAQDRCGHEIGRTLDAARTEAWRAKAEAGHYLRPLLHVYFIWDPRVHHRVTGKSTRRNLNSAFRPRCRLNAAAGSMKNCWQILRVCWSALKLRCEPQSWDHVGLPTKRCFLRPSEP